MKELVFLFICLISFQNVNSQTEPIAPDTNEDNSVYNSAGLEIKPEYKGGFNKFYEYIAKNYRTPDVPGLKGKLLVSFVVEKDGSITDIKVLKDIGYGTGEEAIRILKKCPNWTPAEQKGKKVRCTFMLPINIQAP
jgi:periplasmic protein TonB